MPKYAQNLTLRDIKLLTKPGLYSIGYVPGLCVRVTTAKTSYYFRYQIQRIPRVIVIGDIKFITLNQAKAIAHDYLQERRKSGKIYDDYLNSIYRQVYPDFPF